MTDDDVYDSPDSFDDVSEAPRKKKGGIPTWVWVGCGGGCLLIIIAIVVLGFLGKQFVENAMDPEKQLPNLQQVLPFEEQPANLEMNMGMDMFGAFQQYVLTDTDTGYMAIVYVFGAEAEQEVYELLKENPRSSRFTKGMGSLEGFEEISMQLQGEKVRGIQFTGVKGPEQDVVGSGARINLHEAGIDGCVVELRKPGEDEPPSELEIEEFFAVFNLF